MFTRLFHIVFEPTTYIFKTYTCGLYNLPILNIS